MQTSDLPLCLAYFLFSKSRYIWMKRSFTLLFVITGKQPTSSELGCLYEVKLPIFDAFHLALCFIFTSERQIL